MKHEDIKKVVTEKKYIGTNVTICGWVRSVRETKNMVFIELNDGTCLSNIQLVIDKEKCLSYSKENCTIGSSLSASGVICNSQNNPDKVEMNLNSYKIIGKCPTDFPIQKKKQSLENLRDIPHLRSRTNTFNAEFRVRSELIKTIHDFLQENNFIYINAPIITGSNCEGAGDLFRVTTLDIDKISKDEYNSELDKNDFFGKRVNLSVSGQLEAEAMACSLGKVYNFGPSFRAENSNTKRHASEFWLFEPEMAFADLNDSIQIVNDLVNYTINKIIEKCPNELEFFNKYYDKTLIDKLDNCINLNFDIIEYKDAIEILKQVKEKFEFPVCYEDGLKNEHIRFLTDVYFKKPFYIENYPKNMKPFYVKTSNNLALSADLFFPGIGDIIGACQKEDDYDILYQKIKELNMTMEDYLWYLDLRKYGTVPHSGFGLGVERMLMYLTGLDNIRDTINFPRTKCKKLKI